MRSLFSCLGRLNDSLTDGLSLRTGPSAELRVRLPHGPLRPQRRELRDGARQRRRRAAARALDRLLLLHVQAALPRLGASKSLGSAWTAFVQASTGFSDPTNFESLSTDITGALPAGACIKVLPELCTFCALKFPWDWDC